MSRPDRLTADATKKPPLWARAREMFDSLEIRFKFLVSFSLIFLLSMLLCNLFIYVHVRNNIEDRIESELKNTTRMITSLVNTSVTVAIKNHLRAVAEKNLEIVRSIYDKAVAGQITLEEAKYQAKEIMLSQTIGQSGYLYCLTAGARSQCILDPGCWERTWPSTALWGR